MKLLLSINLALTLALTTILLMQQNVTERWLDLYLSREREVNLKLADLAEQQQCLHKAFGEFQQWRTLVAVASRSGWSSAHRFIRQNPLPVHSGCGTISIQGGEEDVELRTDD